MKHLSTLLGLFLLMSLAGCRKGGAGSIRDIDAEIISFSAHKGHIYNIFALDRVHTHSYNAVQGNGDDPWSLHVDDSDVMGNETQLVADYRAHSSIVIYKPAITNLVFTNRQTGETKTVRFSTGARFSLDFDNAEEAARLVSLSRENQRDTLSQLVASASAENFNVSTH